MADYRVTWEIDIIADTPEEACRKAHAYMLKVDLTDPGGANYFDWRNKETDETGFIDFGEEAAEP